jgi:hypothetical protein
MTNKMITDIVDTVLSELTAALDRYPPFHSAHEGYAIIKEELDELWEAIKLKQLDSYDIGGVNTTRTRRMQREAAQVAAMALRFLCEMDKFKN